MANIVCERQSIHCARQVNVGEDYPDRWLALKSVDGLFSHIGLKDFEPTRFERLDHVHSYHQLFLNNEHDASVPAFRHGHSSRLWCLRGNPFFVVISSAKRMATTPAERAAKWTVGAFIQRRKSQGLSKN